MKTEQTFTVTIITEWPDNGQIDGGAVSPGDIQHAITEDYKRFPHIKIKRVDVTNHDTKSYL